MLHHGVHVQRVSSDHLPKIILYGDITEGKHPVGRPKLKYKDVIKRNLKDYGIDPLQWQTVAEDRSTGEPSLMVLLLLIS